jgi:hypothetical protein
MLFSVFVFGQTHPSTLQEETDPNDSNFELYSGKNNVDRRASLANLRKYFGARFVQQAGAPASTGNPESLRNKMVQDLSTGDVYFVDFEGDSVLLYDFNQAGGGSVSLTSSADTLFLNVNNIPIDTVIFSIQSPPDSAFLEQGKLIFPWDGNYMFADSVNIGVGLPVSHTSNASDTIVLDFSETSVHRYTPDANVNHIRFTGLREGFNYIFDYQGSQTITLSDSLQWVRCGNNLRVTGNTVVSFYCAGDTSYVYSNDDNLECYTPQIGAGQEYQAVLDYAVAQGYSSPSLSTQTAQNALVAELVSSGAWALMDQFFCLTGDGDADFSLINWKLPGTRNGTVIGTPTYTSMDGWNSNATSDAINTNYNPSSDGFNLSTSNASVGVWIANASTLSSQFYFGSNFSPAMRGEKWTGTAETQVNGVTVTGTSLSSAPATLLAQHTLSSGTTLTTYSNGQVRNTTTGTASGVTNGDLYLMSINLSGSPFNSSVSTSAKYRFWYVGGDLGDLADEVYTALSNYLTAIGL